MSKFHRGWHLPLALLVAGGVAWAQPPAQTQSQPAQPQQQQPGATSDTQIQALVQSALDANPSLKAAGVTATVANGQVTLMGVVGDKTLKQEANDTAKSITGVSGVQNLITVSPSAAAPGQAATAPGQPPQQPATQPPTAQPTQQGQPPAAEPGATPQTEQSEPQAGTQPGAEAGGLQGQVTSALMSDPQLGTYALTATVSTDGKVTLRGTVPTKQDKRHAKDVVENIAGVEKVRNKIKVDKHVTPMQGQPQQPPPSQQPSPYSGQQQPRPTQPNQPPAMQPGQPPATAQPPNQPPNQPPAFAPNASTRQAPGTATPVAGAEAQSQKAKEHPAEMQAQVSAAIKNPPELGKSSVRAVVTGRNQVSLEGMVSSQNAQPAMLSATSQPPLGGAVAWNAQSSQQAAANPAAPQDEETQLQNALQKDPALSGVTAAVSGNMVTLTGTVASKADKKHAEQTVKRTAPSDTKIHNEIKVQKPPIA